MSFGSEFHKLGAADINARLFGCLFGCFVFAVYLDVNRVCLIGQGFNRASCLAGK
jgi:hypothetical protein